MTSEYTINKNKYICVLFRFENDSNGISAPISGLNRAKSFDSASTGHIADDYKHSEINNYGYPPDEMNVYKKRGQYEQHPSQYNMQQYPPPQHQTHQNYYPQQNYNIAPQQQARYPQSGQMAPHQQYPQQQQQQQQMATQGYTMSQPMLDTYMGAHSTSGESYNTRYQQQYGAYPQQSQQQQQQQPNQRYSHQTVSNANNYQISEMSYHSQPQASQMQQYQMPQMPQPQQVNIHYQGQGVMAPPAMQSMAYNMQQQQQQEQGMVGMQSVGIKQQYPGIEAKESGMDSNSIGSQRARSRVEGEANNRQSNMQHINEDNDSKNEILMNENDKNSDNNVAPAQDGNVTQPRTGDTV